MRDPKWFPPDPGRQLVEESPLKKRDLLTLLSLASADVRQLVEQAWELKQDFERGLREPLLARKVVALLFEKPSLRTRVSFEAAMAQLGGTTIYLGQDVGWGVSESIEDFARTLSRYVDAIVFRGTEQATCEQLATFSRCPVINGLTKSSHPCQALADALTIREHFGQCEGISVAYVGDGNNVAASLAAVCGHLQMDLTLAHPAGYGIAPEFLNRFQQRFPDAHWHFSDDPAAAVRHAKVVYTDVWVSMGDEAECEARRNAFRPFQVNRELLSLADPEAIFLHCLPARRGEEVTDEVLDSSQSAAFDQAENRMHMHKAILLWALGVS